MKNRIIAILGVAAGLLASQPGVAQEAASDSVRSARDALSQWVETQQIISKERKDWQQGKEVLEERIALLESEIQGVESKISEFSSTVDEVDSQRRELVAERQSLELASTELRGSIDVLEKKTRELVPALPEVLRSRLEPLIRRIPEGSETQLTLSQRFQSVIGILNEVNKFNRDITITSELRELKSGKTAEVETLYIGLGTAYYVTADASFAGIGRPTSSGWEWSDASALAPDISRTIKIFKNEDIPAYVPLPVNIQ